jgi:hypothetical protein
MKDDVPCLPRVFPSAAALRLLKLGDLSNMLSASAASCGAVSQMQLGRRNVYFVATPALVKEICVEKAGAFPDREALSDADISAGCPMPLGLTLARYDAWNRARSVLNPSFFRQDELAKHAQVLVGKVQHMITHWEERTSHSPVIDLQQDCTALSQSVLLHLLFSLDERLWEHSHISVRAVPLPVRVIEEMLAWKWLLQEQIDALRTADRSFFRFVKAFTNRPGQLSALRARARITLRSASARIQDARYWVLALFSLTSAISHLPRAALTIAALLFSSFFNLLRWLSKEIDLLHGIDRSAQPLSTTPTSTAPPAYPAPPTLAEGGGERGGQVHTGSFAGGGRGGAVTATRVLPGYLERVIDRRSLLASEEAGE